MAASDVRKNFNVFADGRGYAGQATEFNAPKLKLKLEDFQAGGMDMPIELTMGMEKLNSDFSLVKYDADVLALFGISEGAQKSFTVYEMLESFDGQTTQVIHNLTGKISEIDPGTSKPGSVPEVKISLALTYYKMTHGGRLIHEIDVVNMVRVIDGTDVLAAQRNALGM